MNWKDAMTLEGRIDSDRRRLMRAMAVEDWKERDLDENRKPNDRP